jgi:hypothetical protein
MQTANVATTIYRRANGSRAVTSHIRAERAPRVFPRASTPSIASRTLARYERLAARIGHEAAGRQMHRALAQLPV